MDFITNTVKDSETEKDYTEINELIETLPEQYRLAFEEASEKLIERDDRRRRIFKFIQDSLAQLRLDMKYLMFDLEATRRERDEYRKELERHI